MQVYLHVLPEPAAVVDWVKGTLLTDYKRRLAESEYDAFLARYRALLLVRAAGRAPLPVHVQAHPALGEARGKLQWAVKDSNLQPWD